VFLYLTVEENLASGGGDQLVGDRARALIARAPLIVFDESSLGLAPTILETTFGIVDIRRPVCIAYPIGNLEREVRVLLDHRDRRALPHRSGWQRRHS
jgi:hypothetical protein